MMKAKEARRVTRCMRSAPCRALRGSLRLGQSVATLHRSHASLTHIAGGSISHPQRRIQQDVMCNWGIIIIGILTK